MPSPSHEAPIDLFRRRPALLARLLREQLGVEVPAYRSVSVVPGEFTNLPQYRPDLPVTFTDGRGRVTFAVALELQQRRDPDKPFRWPLYAAVLRAHHRCPAAVVVVTPRTSVARWARQPLEDAPGCVFRPLVIGPDEIPEILSIAAARASPDLAVLSAMAHWREHPETLAPVVTAIRAASALPRHIGKLYYELLDSLLSPAGRETLKEIMATHPTYRSPLVREFIEEGRREGERDGERKGALKAFRSTLRSILRARRIVLTAGQRERVAACSDEASLQRWILRATNAKTAAGVFRR